MPLIPAQVTFRGLGHSKALEAEVNDRIAWLERSGQSIVGCRVVVEVRHHHQREGRAYHVRLDMTVAGFDPIIIDHEATLPDAIDAIHQAFDLARRRLHSAADARRDALRRAVAAF